MEEGAEKKEPVDDEPPKEGAKGAGEGPGTLIPAAIALVTLLAIAVVLTGNGSTEPITIGAIVPLSGFGGPYGLDLKAGIELAVDDVNARGGINGRPLKILFKDSKTDPAEGMAAFQALESSERPLVYLSCLSSVSTALVPLAFENGVVVLALVTSAPDVTTQNEWVYRYWPTASSEVPVVIDLLRRLKVRDVGLLYMDDEYGGSMAAELRTRVREVEDVGTVTEVPFGAQETSFGDHVEALGDVDAVWIVGFASHMKGAIGVLRERGFAGHIVTTNPIMELQASPIAQDVYVTVPTIYDPNFLLAQQVKGRFETRSDRSFTHNAANGYDAMMLLSGLLEGEELTRGNVRAVLERGFVHPGILGNVELRAGERDITFPLRPARIEGGEIVYLT